jgi:excisionase family DNA binding protein
MSDSHGTYRRASVLEAAALLGVSPTTVRRMVRAGTLQAERVLRPQGHTFVVLVPTSSQPAASSSQQVSAAARTEQPRADAMMSLIQTTIAAVLGPLMVEQAALRQAGERQAGEIAGLREDRGRLLAENRALLARTGPRSAESATKTLAARLRPIAVWLLVALALAAVLALAWPR